MAMMFLEFCGLPFFARAQGAPSQGQAAVVLNVLGAAAVR